MRIVIDMQGAQTESRFRGIGRYSLSLTRAIVRNRGEHEIILALSGLFPETIEPIRAAFDGLLLQENIRVWHAPGPIRECDSGNKWRRETAALIREAFLASLNPDVVYISSLFEGYVDDAVTSIGEFATHIPTAVTLYDLIPLLSPEIYTKHNKAYEAYYFRKIEYLKRANCWVAISDSAAIEGRDALGLPSIDVVNISTACDDVFHRLEISEDEKRKFLIAYGITKSFILYSGGADSRKNLKRLIRAYSQLHKNLQDTNQLVFAGRMPKGAISELRQISKSAGLRENQLIFTGYVTDEELAKFYNLCKVFIFPSVHEGFGLPVLEAMTCGAATIGSNATSVPEIIGRQDALFDPCNEESISQKLTQVLNDKSFRNELVANGYKQSRKFSWDRSACSAIKAFESLHAKRALPQKSVPLVRRPKLAFVSPLPPERTGIADYSSELLPALAEHYDIEVVVAQDSVDDPWVKSHGKVRDVSWFRTHADEFDRVLYQVGNSPFHQHMLPLLREIPGTVVLHDFYISGLMSWLELDAGADRTWIEALYLSHGYGAVRERYRDIEAAKRKYPVNFYVLQHAQGLIVHSEYSRKLARQCYVDAHVGNWEVIPLLRSPAKELDKTTARNQLGIDANDFVVCSFGFLDSAKMNHRLLDSWLNSALAQEGHCRLVFVGENNGGEYGSSLLQAIRTSEHGDHIRITGFASHEMFRQYLMAADVAVQLRTGSRGETSAAVLDCMNHALPTIVNANGSMAELDPEAVLMLPDEFDDGKLVEALETLWQKPEYRHELGERARAIILNHHSPTECAKRYAEAIESFHSLYETATPALIRAIAAQKDFAPNDAELLWLSENISATLPLQRPAKRLFLDVTATCSNDLKTGIERVARSLLLALLEAPPAGYRVEPVYLSDNGGEWHYRYARRYTLGLLNIPQEVLDDERVEPESGDLLLGLDLSGDTLVRAAYAKLYVDYRNRGVTVYFMVHDLLPILMPEVFPPGANEGHARWLQAISNFDGAICVSKAVADDLATWQAAEGLELRNRRPFHIGWSHHGADVANSSPSRGLPDNADWTLRQLRIRPSFLMVGTIEPRKGYMQTIEAFSRLWNEGVDVNLVIVGKEGWKGLHDDMRRNIPEIINRIRTHPELNKRLFWLEGISDEYLDKVYEASLCLIFASYGEGFGLPLIEAAQHGLPIIARDIPVFREVAGNNAYYFSGSDGNSLAVAVQTWIRLCDENEIPNSRRIEFMNWQASTKQLLKFILGRGWNGPKNLPSMEQKAMEEHLNLIHQARVNLVSSQLPQGDIILDLGGQTAHCIKWAICIGLKNSI